MRLIDRTKLIEEIRQLEPKEYNNLVTLILNAPTVDNVRHGVWELKHEGAGHYWKCSVCHTNPCIYVTKDTNYCPNCGARMERE